ncbi:MAG: Flp pilus assembly protein CpaB [Pseudomonadota bacterium]|nr:Flp pilus assembly protein CpaB [Pseudomonadota bacterium]
MRTSSIVMLALALVFGLAAAFLGKVWLEGQVPEQKAEKPAAPAATVVVATKQLGFGAELSAASLREIDWPSAAIPPGAFKKISEVTAGDGKRIVLTAIEPNEPVLKTKITGPGQRGTLSALIGDGMKAVSVRVNDVLGVAGFVLPGERVDVMLTRTVTKSEAGGAPTMDGHTDLLLQDVRVLAVDQLADDRAEKPTLSKAVTLEVDSEQAQKLTLGATVGVLSLALRPAGIAEQASARRIGVADLHSGFAGPKTDGGTGSMVTVTRAMERTEYSVQRASN